MRKFQKHKLVIISIIFILSLTLALLKIFQDLPVLWTFSILAVVISIGIVGFMIGYLIGLRRDS